MLTIVLFFLPDTIGLFSQRLIHIFDRYVKDAILDALSNQVCLGDIHRSRRIASSFCLPPVIKLMHGLELLSSYIGSLWGEAEIVVQGRLRLWVSRNNDLGHLNNGLFVSGGDILLPMLLDLSVSLAGNRDKRTVLIPWDIESEICLILEGTPKLEL